MFGKYEVQHLIESYLDVLMNSHERMVRSIQVGIDLGFALLLESNVEVPKHIELEAEQLALRSGKQLQQILLKYVDAMVR